MQNAPAKTVVCLKWGDLYSAEYVNKLYRGVCRHLSPPFSFVAFVDDATGLDEGIEARDINALTFAPQLCNIWWKLAIMHPAANLRGSCLFLDLDNVIVGNLDDFFTAPGRFCIIHNWIERRKTIFRARPAVGNSSVYRFAAGGEPQAAEIFMAETARVTNRKNYRTEQVFLTAAVGLPNITWWDPQWVVSFKRHCLPAFPLNCFVPPRLPAGARIVAFHGKPKQDEVIKGNRAACPCRSWRRIGVRGNGIKPSPF